MGEGWGANEGHQTVVILITYREYVISRAGRQAHLGTGSPNTVIRWLETWWSRLGTRLQRARPDLEDAPAVLAELAGQWWELALKHAQEAVHRELAEAKQLLAAQRGSST